MFDEIALKVNLGYRLHSACQALVSLAGAPAEWDAAADETRLPPLVGISQTLDKLIVYEPDADPEAGKSGRPSESYHGSPTPISAGPAPNVYCIAVRDVIKSIAVKSIALEGELEGGRESLGQRARKDLLLIGCSRRLLIYDAPTRTCLLNVATSLAVDTICAPGRLSGRPPKGGPASRLVICGGPQKLCSVRLDAQRRPASAGLSISGELSSERSTGDTITCLARGELEGAHLVLAGSSEHRISLYQLDSFDHNIQACRLSLDELAPVKCLCAINTCERAQTSREATGAPHDDDDDKGEAQSVAELAELAMGHHQPARAGSSALASASSSSSSLDGTSRPAQTASKYLPAVSAAHKGGHSPTADREQTNYFAYALANGFVGVYRLFRQHLLPAQPTGSLASPPEPASRLATERLWSHKCKYAPVTLLMCDINGDGLDELVIGFRNGRIEARAPFTGQLLCATRCFKSDHLLGLSVIDYASSGPGPHGHGPNGHGRPAVLVASSAEGCLLAYRAPAQTRPRLSLQGYRLEARAEPESSLRAIAEEEQTGSGAASLLLFKERFTSASELHIESHSDDSRPAKTEPRQSADLLQRLSALHNEKLDLDKRACQLQRLLLQRNGAGAMAAPYPRLASQMDVAHRWDFDSKALQLRLTVLVTGIDSVRLALVEDEQRNFLPAGSLLLHPRAPRDDHRRKQQQQQPQLKQVNIFLVPLVARADIAGALVLRVFCEPRDSPGGSQYILSSTIAVPKYCMFAPATADFCASTKAARCNRFELPVGQGEQIIKLLLWLEENFLCLQFGRPASRYAAAQQAASSPLQPPSPSPSTPGAQSAASSSAARASSLAAAAEPLGGELGALVARIRRASLLGKLGGGQGGERQPPDECLLLGGLESAADRGADSHLDGTDFDLNLCSFRQQQHSPASATTESTLDGPGAPSPRTGQSQNGTEPAAGECKSGPSRGMLRIALDKTKRLLLECDSGELLASLVQSLVIDRLHLELKDLSIGLAIEPMLRELDSLNENSRRLEETEMKIQTELYESADYVDSLLHQLTIANELNEFATSKELLSELFIMLTSVQSAARAHCLNNRSRLQLTKRVCRLNETIAFLTGNQNQKRPPTGVSPA